MIAAKYGVLGEVKHLQATSPAGTFLPNSFLFKIPHFLVSTPVILAALRVHTRKREAIPKCQDSIRSLPKWVRRAPWKDDRCTRPPQPRFLHHFPATSSDSKAFYEEVCPASTRQETLGCEICCYWPNGVTGPALWPDAGLSPRSFACKLHQTFVIVPILGGRGEGCLQCGIFRVFACFALGAFLGIRHLPC